MFNQFRAKTALVILTFAMSVLCANAQNKAIRGTVVDESGAAVIGASVVVVGNSTNGAMTDLDGKFSLNVPSNANISVSCIGYETQVLSVANQTNFNITLKEDTEFLEETVVVGYGVQRKSDVTGAIASVRGQDLENRSTSDAANALMGKAAGVQIINASGAPGSASEIRVRGYSSNSGNIGPLLIVDGLKVDNIQYLDPEMIESMEVLKDAASAAIYGAEAGNGVVLITTKTGKKGDGQIFYNDQFSLSTLARKLDILNAQEYIQFGKEFGWLNQGMLDSVNYNGCDTDWGDEVFEPTWSQRHTIGAQGGNDKSHYFISINNVNNNGIFKGNKDVYKRLTLQVNADYKIKSWFTVGTNTSIEKYSTKNVSQHSDNGSAMLAALTSSPLFPVKTDYDGLTDAMKSALASGKRVVEADEEGMYWALPLLGETQSANPFIRRDATDSKNSGFNIRGTVFANLSPIKGLTVTSRFGYRITQSNSHSYTAPYYANAFVFSDTYSLSASANNGHYYQWENFANYNKTIAKKHTIGAMIGMSYTENNRDNVSGSASGADILKGYEPNFRYLDYLLSSTAVTKSVSNAPGKSTNLSYYGRVSYSYADKYNVQVNFRADAFDSSKLAKKTRWGYFPSVSAGWTLSNESFFKNAINRDVLSFVKIRASWGRNGNVNVLSGYRYDSTISYNGQWYQFDPLSPDQEYGSMPSGLSNPDLKWETSDQVDVGLDLRMFNNRLSFGVDYYQKKTKDLLVSINPTAEVGVSSTTVNAGSVKNSGLEFELTWKDQIGDFGYSVSGNIATLKNKVTYLEPSISRIMGTGPQGVKFYTAFEEGYPVYYMRGYVSEGVDPATGEGKYKDLNNDGKIDDVDLTKVGSGIPDITYGITLNFNYKNLDLVVFGTGAAGSQIYPTAFRIDRPSCNTYKYYYDNRWTESHTNAKVPAPAKWDQNFLSSTLNVFSGNYFKIKQIQLGYNLPKSILKKVFISKLRVFASLDNFITFSNYPGLDPETASAGSSSSLGIDMGSYPTAKSVIFGINLSF